MVGGVSTAVAVDRDVQQGTTLLNKAAFVALVLLTAAFDTPLPPPVAARTSAAPPVVPLAPGCHLNYYGGKVIANVVVIEVNWGSGVDATVQSSIGGFY